MEDEPQAKRQALGIDFSSLVKEAVFDSQQVEGQVESTTKTDQSQMVTIPSSTTAQETENTQLSGLSQTSEGGNFITMETQPVVMVTESVLHSMQDGHGIVTDYQDNNHSLLGDGDEKLAAQNTQPYTPPEQTTVQPQQTDHDAQYAKIHSPEIPVSVSMEATQDVSVSMETTQDVSVSMETTQDISVSMETASEEARERIPANENSLKTAEGEQSIEDYSTQTPCTETTNNTEQMNVSLMFESGQQLTEEEAPVVTHSSTVPTVNNTPAVFTQ
ncbi:hypothetical protein OS493_017340 [Desmophyllum pertusum]|uniref:Uncharacterized protein n=1 Tax=Desmophyllum pertusum TaxID=174260 RepID=A0A9X0A2C3_9CNID|nr:hypothetical protein OS493_017340 [Desmophyllum pertusum]